MARSLSDFSRRITLVADGITERADQLVRKVALVADQTIVSATPVDTGRARSNWIVALNAPVENTIQAYLPGEYGSTAGENVNAALAQGRGVIANYVSGNEIHITNNLPYIQKLNDGYSRQAPANFVEKAVLESVNAVRRARLLGRARTD